MVKTREAGNAANRAIYLAIGANTEGQNGGAGPVDGRHRRRQVLAVGGDRTEESRGAGHPHCLRRWAEGLSRGDPSRVPAGRGAALYRSFGTQQPELCQLESAQGSGS